MEAIIYVCQVRQCMQLSHVPFLPKLQSLRWIWDGQDRMLAALAPLLSGPRLLRLTLSVQQDQTVLMKIHPTTFGAIMRNFGNNATSLQHVVQSFKVDPPTQITDAVVQLLYKLTNLKSFECRSPLPNDTVTFLSRLPHLSDLDIRLSRNLREPTLTSDLNKNFFPSLQAVHMRAKEVRRSILFLENIQSQFLKKVNMTTSARTLLLSELQDYFKALGSKGSVEKIIVQKFSGASGRTYPENFSIITFDIFAPLLRLRNVTILAVSSGFAVDLDDRAILRFATAWPNLYRLSILSEQPLLFKPRMSLEGIFAVFQKCAGIYTIALTFDPSLPSQSTMQQLASLRLSRPELGINFHQMTVRNCGLVGDSESMAVAEFLHSMFPGCHLAVDDLKSHPSEVRRIQSWEGVRKEVRRLRQGYKAKLGATVGEPGELLCLGTVRPWSRGLLNVSCLAIEEVAVN